MNYVNSDYAKEFYIQISSMHIFLPMLPFHILLSMVNRLFPLHALKPCSSGLFPSNTYGLPLELRLLPRTKSRDRSPLAMGYI